MSQILTSMQFRGINQTISRVLPLLKQVLHLANQSARKCANVCMPYLMRLLKLTFVSGPMQLLTSRITGKCATVMIFMCVPALLTCSLLTVPGLIFKFPQQTAYFYFSSMLDQDPTRWMVMLLAGTCALFSLAIPASMPSPETQIRY